MNEFKDDLEYPLSQCSHYREALDLCQEWQSLSSPSFYKSRIYEECCSLAAFQCWKWSSNARSGAESFMLPCKSRISAALQLYSCSTTQEGCHALDSKAKQPREYLPFACCGKSSQVQAHFIAVLN
jgi:hypothetical protein